MIPEHPLPDALQITTLIPGPLAENCICEPGFTCGELGLIVTGEEAGTIVTVALANLVGEATDVAVTVTLAEAGMLAGPVYKPEVEIDPQDEPEQPVPETVHFTAVFVVPVTFAVNCCCPLTLT